LRGTGKLPKISKCRGTASSQEILQAASGGKKRKKEAISE